jgi:hypothetical protein
MKEADFCFYYKNIMRRLIVNKLFIINLNSLFIPKLCKIFLFFVIKNLDILDDARTFNYFYLIKFFFGKKCFFAQYVTKFSLNVLYHSFVVQAVFVKNDMYFCLFFLLNDVIPFLSKKNILISKSARAITYSILDMNIFMDKKTNLGLFTLKDCINFKFILAKFNFYTNKGFLFNLFKL